MTGIEPVAALLLVRDPHAGLLEGSVDGVGVPFSGGWILVSWPVRFEIGDEISGEPHILILSLPRPL
ncbi:hypothetical protein LG634_08790 [Streptomyces bambusae]|uniref:hypothetical protein n=1 Tax=Streptomyces bambusae TaxID=1550616 RepID=UPI001CFE5152|nr:hypothetical protein [Streptomyces bambusae]MCB5164924.1 hypothetical protein [Streptomyces bambusae]